MSGSTSIRQSVSPRVVNKRAVRAGCRIPCTHWRQTSMRFSKRALRCLLLGALSGAASPNPSASLSTMRSMSSEKRWMICQAFDSEVPPLNVRWSPMAGRVKSSRRVHQQSMRGHKRGRPTGPPDPPGTGSGAGGQRCHRPQTACRWSVAPEWRVCWYGASWKQSEAIRV